MMTWIVVPCGPWVMLIVALLWMKSVPFECSVRLPAAMKWSPPRSDGTFIVKAKDPAEVAVTLLSGLFTSW